MYFNISNLYFKIQGIDRSYIPMHLKQFNCDYVNSSYITYSFHIIEEYPPVYGTPLFHNEDLLVLKKDNLENRALFIKGDSSPYGITIDNGNGFIDVFVHKKILNMLNIDTIFISLLSLENKLIYKDNFILHCANINYKDEAILFSGPSNVGKSTQADLWKKNLSCEIVNGDRALIRKYDSFWYANGWPICGSSDYCMNLSKKIRSIVFLKQSKKNKLIKLTQSVGIKSLISQTTINYWDSKFVNKALDLIENLTLDIPIYEFHCTPDINAVQCLKKELEVL